MSDTIISAAELRVDFSNVQLDACRNCGKQKDTHVNEHCLFESSRFEQSVFEDMCDAAMRSAPAVVTIKVGPYTLTGSMRMTAKDTGWSTRLRQASEARLSFGSMSVPITLTEDPR